MSKILFAPFSALGAVLAGFLGRKLFARLWSVIDKHEPPDPTHRDAPWSKVLSALLLEGAIFTVVRGSVDRGLRVLFSKVAGSWPGQKRAEES